MSQLSNIVKRTFLPNTIKRNFSHTHSPKNNLFINLKKPSETNPMYSVNVSFYVTNPQFNAPPCKNGINGTTGRNNSEQPKITYDPDNAELHKYA